MDSIGWTSTSPAVHIADTVDAHDASAISVADSGDYFVGTDAEAVLAELGANNTYVATAKRAAAAIRTLAAIPSVHSSPPTKTYSASTSVSGFVAQYNNYGKSFATIGCVPFNQTVGSYLGNQSMRTSNGGADPWGIEFDFYGADVEINWRTQVSQGERFWVWVDGMPLTAAPEAPGALTTVAGSAYALKLAFGSAAWRRITVYASSWALQFLRGGTITDSFVATTVRRPSIYVLCDSWGGATSYANPIQQWPFVAGTYLGASMVIGSLGGTGYTQDGGYGYPYTSSSRLDAIALAAPDIVVVQSSINDDSGSSAAVVGAACTTVLDGIVSRLPSTPIIVTAQQTNNATASTASTRQVRAAAIYTAALANRNVIGWIDPAGITSALPTAYSGATAYTAGQLIVYNGGVYECINAVTGLTPQQTPSWALRSWFTGTGNAGSTASNGNRDVMLAADGAHPTVAGAELYGRMMAGEILRVLKSAAF